MKDDVYDTDISEELAAIVSMISSWTASPYLPTNRYDVIP